MEKARISELLSPFLDPANLTTGDLNHISMYIDILLRWNSRINLTAVRDPEQIVTRHFGESFFAARHLFPTRSIAGISSPEPGSQKLEAVADLGSGAGFPGIPIKLWIPSISLTLIESNHKKATFLSEIARSLTLTDINIQTARAETLTNSQFDVVTLRAVERFETILPVAARLVRPAGRLALLISSAQQEVASATLTHFEWSVPQPIPCSNSRILFIGDARPTYQVSNA